MRQRLIVLTLTSLLFVGCASTPLPDVQATVHAAVAATLTAQPTEMPTRTPSPEPMPTVRPPATEVPPPLAFSLATYRGQGFSFQYPANAQVKSVSPGGMAWQAVSPATTEIHVAGPEIWIRPGDADWFYRGPAYSLFIRTYENPEALDAEVWARNYILSSWQEAKRLERPWGALP
ncbi:MAG: hypothetical protein JXA89_20635, partial [Anaerolineae bacterium]|nr:hypothetical protein [Anaerolineae bacterium]